MTENSHAKPEMHFQIARVGLSGMNLGESNLKMLYEHRHLLNECLVINLGESNLKVFYDIDIY